MKNRAFFVLIVAALASGCTPASETPSGENKELSWKNKSIAACSLVENRKSQKASKKRVSLRLQLPWFANGEYSYAYLGKELGIFAFHGFDVTLNPGKGSDVAARALAAGSAEAAFIGGDALVLVNQEGGDLRSLGAVYEETPVTIYSLADKNISKDNLSSLYGKRLGLMPGSNTFTQYNGWANMASVSIDGAAPTFDRKRVKEVIVQGAAAPGWITTPVGDNSLDALVHYTQFAALQARVEGHKVNEIRLSEPPLNVKIYGMLLSVREGVFDEEQLYQLKAAVYDSFVCGRGNRTASIDALARANPDVPFGTLPGQNKERPYAIAQLNMMIDHMACKNRGTNCEQFLSQNDDYWNATVNTLIKFKLLKKRTDLDTLRIKLE